MWTYRLWVLFGSKWQLWQEGSRDQVMFVMCSAREAARLVGLGAAAWDFTQEFIPMAGVA